MAGNSLDAMSNPIPFSLGRQNLLDTALPVLAAPHSLPATGFSVLRLSLPVRIGIRSLTPVSKYERPGDKHLLLGASTSPRAPPSLTRSEVGTGRKSC